MLLIMVIHSVLILGLVFYMVTMCVHINVVTVTMLSLFFFDVCHVY